jgi:hypothetical protein
MSFVKFEFKTKEEAEEALLTLVENPPKALDKLVVWGEWVKKATANYRAIKASFEVKKQ